MATKAKKAGKQRSAIDRFYAGEPLDCPIGCGGAVEIVRVSTLEGGGGAIWYECTACAQRASVEAPPSSPAERQQVQAGADAGRETVCPRHSTHRVVLRRRGRQLACPECGVVFREQEQSR